MKSLRFCNESANGLATLLDRGVGKDQNPQKMERPLLRSAGFSLVEVTLALGVAAICLLTLLALLPTATKTQQTSIQQTTANQIIAQISSILRADISLPPGQANKVCPDPPDPNEPCNWSDLHGHWKQVAAPDTMYFTNEGKQTGNLNGSPPAGAVFRAKITYRFPPSDTTSLADIAVSWPAVVDPAGGGVPSGYIITTLAVNR